MKTMYLCFLSSFRTVWVVLDYEPFRYGVISVNRDSHDASVVLGPWSALSNEQDLKSNYCYIAINFNLLFSFAVTVRPRPWHLPNLQVTGLSGRPQQLFDPELAAMFPEMSAWKSGLTASILLNQWNAVQIAKLRVLHFFLILFSFH